MQVQVVHPLDLNASDVDQWEALQLAGNDSISPFLTPEYAVILGRIYGNIRVAVAEEAGKVCCYFPFAVGSGGVATTMARGLSDRSGLVVHPDFQFNMRALLAKCKLSGWDFTNLPTAQAPSSARFVVAEPSPFLDLRGGYEAYIDQRRKHSKNVVQSTMRKQRKMEREVGEISFEFASTRAADLQLMMDWKSIQYRQMAEWDRFADPLVVRLVRHLHEAETLGCAGLLSTLSIDGKPVAIHFGVRSRHSIAWWFPTYDPALGRYSPGLQLLLRLAEAGAEHGLRQVDLGLGFHQYKQALMSDQEELCRGYLGSGLSGAATAVRLARRAPRYYARRIVRGNERLHSAYRQAASLAKRLQSGDARRQ